MRLIAFHQTAFDDDSAWAKTDKKVFERIHRLIVETAKTPFDGIGKPEPSRANSRAIGRAASRMSIALFIKRRTHN